MSDELLDGKASASTSKRLMSLDALRGFDMLWIVGGGGIVKALDGMGENSTTQFWTEQLTHVEWEGMVFFDLIFPLFLFIAGVSMVFSLDRSIERGERGKAIRRVWVRSVLLFIVGVFYYGGIAKRWPDVQLTGVLQRIAICYFFGATIYCLVRSRCGLLGVSVVLLVGYWGLITYVPIPDLMIDKSHVEAIAKEIDTHDPHAIVATVTERISGSYEEGRNLTNYVDYLYLPGRKKPYYMNEGLLSVMPAIAYLLIGAIAGRLLKDSRTSDVRKVAWLVMYGVTAVLVGLVWSEWMPPIKRIWTSSFVVLSIGWSLLLLALFYFVIDVCRVRFWSKPFVWIGCNALTIYVGSKLLNVRLVSSQLAGGDLQIYLNKHVGEGVGGLVVAVTGLMVVILFARFMYKRGLFIRL